MLAGKFNYKGYLRWVQDSYAIPDAVREMIKYLSGKLKPDEMLPLLRIIAGEDNKQYFQLVRYYTGLEKK